MSSRDTARSLLLLRLHLLRERLQLLVHLVQPLLPFGAGHAQTLVAPFLALD